jgi:hypothetical protein
MKDWENFIAKGNTPSVSLEMINNQASLGQLIQQLLSLDMNQPNQNQMSNYQSGYQNQTGNYQEGNQHTDGQYN